MVVISIIAILSSVLYVNVSKGSAQSRDVERQADLRTMEIAIGLYKNKYGRYPEGCNSAGTWSGHAADYKCSSGNQYIVGLAPEFIPRLPQDPKLNGNNSGYVYTTNTEGTVFKLMVKNTVEAETVDLDHEFKSCDVSGQGFVNCSQSNIPRDPPSLPNNRCDRAMCDRVYPTYNVPNWCRANNQQFQTSYGVWGGFAAPTISISNANYDLLVERDTEEIVCEIQ